MFFIGIMGVIRIISVITPATEISAGKYNTYNTYNYYNTYSATSTSVTQKRARTYENLKLLLREGFQGLRRPRKRSLLEVNEHFEGKRNAEKTLQNNFYIENQIYIEIN